MWNLRLPSGQGEGWTPDILKLGAETSSQIACTWEKRKRKRREEGRKRERDKMHSVAQTVHVLELSTYLSSYFSAFLPCFPSSHAKVQSDQEPLLGQESPVL